MGIYDWDDVLTKGQQNSHISVFLVSCMSHFGRHAFEFKIFFRILNQIKSKHIFSGNNQKGGFFMKCIKIILISLLTSIFTMIPAFAANLNKIGVVDFQKILETSKVGKAAQKEIKSEGEKMEETLKEKGSEIEALKKKLERDALVIDRDTRAEREREIRIKINDIKALQKKYMADFRDLEARMIDRIRSQLIDIIESIGKQDGFLLIMEKNQAGVLYSPGSVDITEKVIRLYNQKVEK